MFWMRNGCHGPTSRAVGMSDSAVGGTPRRWRMGNPA